MNLKAGLQFGEVPDSLALALAALILAVPLTGCGNRKPKPTKRNIVVTVTTDIRGVNELTVDTTYLHTAIHYYALFLPLLDEQPGFEEGPATFEPRLALSHEISGGGKEITFRLRDDAVWSDGEPITAEDVRWTWQAQVHPDVAWAFASYKRFIRDVEVVDPHTVRFLFERAYGTQLLDANLGVILPKHAWSRLPFSQWRERGDWFVDHLVVAGPFDLEAWEPGERLVLRRNERYFEADRPRSDRLIFRVTPDRDSQVSMLRSGEAHFADRARPADAAHLEADPNIELLSYLPRGSQTLVWNTRHPLFSSREVRQALTLAIDRQTIVNTLYHGYANVTDSPFSSNSWVYNKSLEARPYDPDRAREMLAARGWIDRDGDGVLDRDGRRFSFEVLTVAGNEHKQDILVLIQDQLARVGIEMSQRVLEFNTLFARERNHDFEASLSSMGIGTDLDLSFFYHSASIDNGHNLSSYSNSEVDRLLDEIKARPDPLTAKPLFDQVQTLIYEDCPITLLHEPLHLIPVHKTLRGVSPNALSSFFDLEEWELASGG